MHSLLMRSRLLEANEKASMAKIASCVYASSAAIGVRSGAERPRAGGRQRRQPAERYERLAPGGKTTPPTHTEFFGPSHTQKEG